ncbi:MAG: sulfatase family protein [Verrucomicrobiia bacterium]
MKPITIFTLILSTLGICLSSIAEQPVRQASDSTQELRRDMQDRPNIILLMGDDHGWEETGYNGHPYVKTPVLDEMAATGLHLENFYSGHPTCSPTRASFLTGRHPNRMGTFSPGWSFRPEEITSAHIMGKAGYRSAHFGKWHVGTVKAGSPLNPGAMGFDEWLSHDNFFEMNPSFSRNGGPPKVYQGESSEILVRELIDFIGRASGPDKPFFTVVWFGSPHEPYSGLPADLALYDNLPGKYKDKQVRLTSNETGSPTTRPQGDVLRERYAEITAMDRSIGTLRAYLADEGLRNDTLLFYCGDNGTSRDGSLVTPHRGVKGEVYDGGILVPGLIEWPARISKPRSTKIRASTSDLLPTLSGIVGQALPERPIDGIDLTPLIDGTMTSRSNPLYFWKFANSNGNGAQSEDYLDPELQVGTTPLVKLMGGIATRNFKNLKHPTIRAADYLGPRAIIDGRFKLVVRESKSGETEQELFDLKKDPAETKNLIGKKPATAKKLQAELRKWQESVLNSLTGADY